MRPVYVSLVHHAARVAERGPAYAAAVEAAVVRRTATAIYLDPDGLSRLAPAPSVAPPIPPVDQPTLDALKRVPWPHRGAMLWMLLRDQPAGSRPLLDAVTPLVDSGGCACRFHWAAYLRDHPPTFGDGSRRWVWTAHNAVNRRRGVAEVPWREAERRHAMADRFGAVRVISLARTPDRLDDFYRRLPRDWPLALPTVFSAVDGRAEPPPDGWWPDAYHGLRCGAWGCRQSHLGVLRGVAADDRPAVIMEDDFEAAPGFAVRLAAFMDALPDDWEIAYLGCQHQDAPSATDRPGVLRVNGAERTHAMIVHPRAFAWLAGLYADGPHHIDWQLRDAAKGRRFYAADPPLAAQGDNTSTIEGDGTRFGRRDWSRSPSAFGMSPDEVAFRAKLAARQTAPWPDADPVPPPAVFYHVACMGHWREVVREQCRLLAHVGLTRATAGVLGAEGDAAEAVAIAAACGVTLDVGYRSDDLHRYETPTLSMLHAWAKVQPLPAPALYLHTKGVSAPADAHKGPWRRLMQRHVVADWRANVRLLRTADICGMNWQPLVDHPHFSGNFWIARSDWLAGLNDPESHRASRPATYLWAGHPWARMHAELWLGSRPWHHVAAVGPAGVKLWEGPDVFRFDSAVAGFNYDG